MPRVGRVYINVAVQTQKVRVGVIERVVRHVGIARPRRLREVRDGVLIANYVGVGCGGLGPLRGKWKLV